MGTDQSRQYSVYLEPNKDNQTQSFESANLLHCIEFEQVLDIINKQININKSYDPMKDNRPTRVHNTITLSGSRGSGKTSFLLSLKNHLETSHKEILFLDIIDPTLIEEKGHVFLNIVARIKTLVQPVIDKEKPSGNNNFKEWEEALKELAAGLPMLDGINGGLDPSDWNDTTFVMMDGLRRVEGANNLELFFHRYIHLSLLILKKTHLIIAFDDVDTDFSKGWAVLEVLRKYLTSPQIISFLSGDIGLYSFLVRKKQWRNFGKTLLKNEYDKGETGSVIYSSEYPELVEKLESQYMMKLLKPEYRITLSTIASKQRAKQIEISVKDGDDTVPINTMYQDCLSKAWGVKGRNVSMSYISFFTSLPLRTQLSLLNTFIEANNSEEDSTKKLYKLSKGVTDVFHSELRTANVDVWEMVNGYGLTNIYMLKFLLDNNKLDEASQFFPKLNNPSIDGAVTAMGAVLTERLSSNPFEIFDHIIRVSNVVAKADKWDMGSDKTWYSISDFVEHSRSLYDYGLKKIASLQSAYIISFENDLDVKNEGLILIENEQLRSKKRYNPDNKKIDEIFKNKSFWINTLGYLPAFSIQNSKGESTTLYSFFNLLATIGDIVRLDKEEAKHELIRAGQLRTFPQFRNKNELLFIEEDLGVEDTVELVSYTSEEDPQFQELVDEMFLWKEKWNNTNILIPPYLIGRIMVRTLAAFTNISMDSNTNVAGLIHRQIVIFVNAILVEEVMENEGNSKLRLVNPSNENDYFVTNLNNNKESDHPLFDYIFSCPLLQAYLEPELFDSLKLESPKHTIYDILSDLNIKDVTIREEISFERLSRIVIDNDEDADRIIDYLQQKQKSKEDIEYWDIDRAIRVLFSNRRVYRSTGNRLLSRIKRSDRW